MQTNLKYPFYVIGIDLGGTKIGGGLVKYVSAENPPVVEFRDKIPSEGKLGPKKLVDNLIKISKQMFEKAKELHPDVPVVAIGIASAGRCNKVAGSVDTATDVFPDFAHTPVCDLVSQALGLDCYLLNDVQAHTLGESRWGAGKNAKHMVMLAIGTGIGGGVIVDGKLMRGTHGYAGELGHVQAVLAKDVDCNCGKSSHLESIASGSGIERVYNMRTGKVLSGPEISELASHGDEDAIYCLQLAGRSLGQIIAGYQSMFDPEMIIISGSVVKAGPIWEDAMQAGIQEEIIEDIYPNLVLCNAQLGEDAPLVGAAENALDCMKE